jgi:hypothetical protein
MAEEIYQESLEIELELRNYMRITRRPVGYPINFGHKGTLEWKRTTIAEFIPDVID